MTLLAKIKADQITARKDKNKFHTRVLTTLYAECQRPGLDDKKRMSTDNEVLHVVRKFIKGVDESIRLQGNEASDLLPEKAVYLKYLPKQLTTTELHELIENIIQLESLSGMQDMGKVMNSLTTHHTGLYDGKVAASYTRLQLS